MEEEFTVSSLCIARFWQQLSVPKLSTKHYTDLFHHNPRCRNLVMSSQGNTNHRYSILEYNLVHWIEVFGEFAFTVTVDKYPDFIGENWMPAGP